MNKLGFAGLVFLAITGAVFLLQNVEPIQFGHQDFWDKRGIFFLVFVTAFPRLTLLFSSVISGGFLWWLSWLIVPRVLVATLATISYWEQNKILVTIAWLIAIGAETSEKRVVYKKTSKYQTKKIIPQGEVIDVTAERKY